MSTFIQTLFAGLRLGSIYALVALFQFTQRTRLGRAMRCVSEDKEAATLMGINVNHTILAAMVMFPVNYQIKNGAWVALLSASVRGVFQYPMLVYAVLCIIIIVFRPKGIFGALKAVQNFNIQIYQGELVGLIGLNGAGKTTVFNLLTGVYVPTETAELLECINTIRGRFGAAILLIEHDMSLAMNVCERIQVIDYGQTIASSLPEETANDPKVIAAYLGE